MTFLEKRDALLERALLLKSNEDLTDDFKREFFDLVSTIIIGMLDSEDNFFGGFMIKIERGIRLDITWPLATMPKMDGFLMYFNPILFLQNDKKEMAALFKHEIYHMMYSHYDREKSLKDSFSNEAISMALDISINQYIKNMPMEAQRLETVSRELDVELKSNRAIEEYAKEIQKAINKRIDKSKKDKNSDSVAREIDISKAHEIWEDIDVSDKSIKENVKKIAISLKDSNKPEDLYKIISAYEQKEELSWEEILKRLIPSMKSGYKKTITRRDRRQPDRMDLRGKLSNNIPELIVAIDISASMTDEDIKKIMIEILAITRNNDTNITVIECDNEIRRIYKLRTPKDIKSRSEKSGSTAFAPVFEYIKEHNLRNNILIYFTDGVGEKELISRPINKKTIWVLTGDEELSLNKPYGEVKRINRKVKKDKGNGSALDYVREVITDWAR
ncbi:vWA domain-containing protein [Clostridium sp. LP20]|uniref:vWA domain-containing protein n=1 Tax=Clostridium sp. LP20 TaxID=3418665 RepID=UPI003EE5CA7A